MKTRSTQTTRLPRRRAIPMLTLLISAVAVVEAADATKTIDRWYAALIKSGDAVSTEQANEALEDLRAVQADQLDDDQKARLQAGIAVAHAAAGDVANAEKALVPLFSKDPNARPLLDAAYIVHVAAGDAGQAGQMLKALRKHVDRSERSELMRRWQWLRDVGTKAPETVIIADDGTRIETTQRYGAALLLDFWTMRKPPTAEEAAALVALYNEHKNIPEIEFAGINADDDAQLQQARGALKTWGYTWRQHYEGSFVEAPISRKAFSARKPPWQVLIDPRGYIRAVGSATEPGFVYAVRALVAEVDDRFALTPPRTRDGKQAYTIETGDSGGAFVAKDDRDSASTALPSNPEAARLLERARLYIKTGRKTDARKLLQEIIDKYPNTREAHDARDRLSLL